MFRPIDVTTEASPSCQLITSTLCQQEGYSYTELPNYLGQVSQDEINLELTRFRQIFALNCGVELQPITCRLLLPPCGQGDQDVLETLGITKSSRQTILSALCRFIGVKCTKFIDDLGITWPENTLCSFSNTLNNNTSNSSGGSGGGGSCGSGSSIGCSNGFETIHLLSARWMKLLTLLNVGFLIIKLA